MMAAASPAGSTLRNRGWDLLLVCVAIYMATAVGRVHQLFGFLTPLKPALVSAGLACAVYIVQQHGPRRFEWLRAPTTNYVLALLLWVGLSIPGALNQGQAFALLTDSFIKTVVLYI